jgi:glutaredoxin
MIARFLLLLLFSIALSGCKKGDNPHQNEEPASAAPKTNELPPLELRDDSPNLLLTWVDEKGDFHVVLKPADVPEGRRDKVRVVVTTREEGTGQLVYVADLGKKQPNGSYVVSTLTRAQWDEVGASRRKARLEALAPSAATPPAGSAPPAALASALPPGSKVVAIIYGAEWCKPCHDAARYLRQRGVNVIEKNIEDSQAAAAELRAKLARANLGTSSIPIIDVNGKILVGYDPRALDQAVEAARSAKTL